jgi:MSHA biogenesis protein MshI
MALSIDAGGGLLTVNFAGELYLSRHLEISAGQLADADDEMRARLFERILVETQRSLDHCERTYPFFALDRVLLAPFAGDTGLREHLAANVYMPIEPLELARVASLPAAAAAWTPEEQAKWLKLIGAGLRVEKKAL